MSSIEKILFRQVHPSFTQGDKISILAFSSMVFKPFPKDEGLLSVYNGEKFDVESAYTHYTELQKLASAGVVGVSVSECKAESLNVIDDNDPFDGHSSIDFKDLPAKEILKKAKMLKAKAQLRGWLYIR